ncbi:MAG TPA: hypothetical protein PKO06_14015, partial [Candidatus Ozemobacteraceae bacterium]|nr:hypothetical protein [Candidatus Ozemobacteraceae bacterium]
MRIVGWDDLLDEEHYQGFPPEFFSVPGDVVESLDGDDLTGEFRAFIHGPFKQGSDEDVGDRNDTSLAMQIVFGDDPSAGGVLLFGDHKYPVIRKIFDITKAHGNEADLRWQVLLMRPVKNTPEFKGRLELVVAGTRDGKSWSQTLSGEGQALQLRQYRRMEGVV